MHTDRVYMLNDIQAQRRIDGDIHTNKHRNTLLLTDGRSHGASASQNAGHEQVSNLSQSQETCRVVALRQLVLNQAFQLIFKHLSTTTRKDFF